VYLVAIYDQEGAAVGSARVIEAADQFDALEAIWQKPPLDPSAYKAVAWEIVRLANRVEKRILTGHLDRRYYGAATFGVLT